MTQHASRLFLLLASLSVTLAPAARADAPKKPPAPSPTAALRFSGSIGYAWTGIGNTTDTPASVFEARAPEDFGVLGYDLGVDLTAANGHGAFFKFGGFTEVSRWDTDLNLVSLGEEDTPAVYNYGSVGLSAGYRVQLKRSYARGTHFMPSLLAGPAIGWLGYDAEDGTETTGGWFTDESTKTFYAGPERDHMGLGFIAGAELAGQSDAWTFGLAAEYTRLWNVAESAPSYVAYDSTLRVLFRVGVLTGI